jgi:hypothetical protein
MRLVVVRRWMRRRLLYIVGSLSVLLDSTGLVAREQIRRGARRLRMRLSRVCLYRCHTNLGRRLLDTAGLIAQPARRAGLTVLI